MKKSTQPKGVVVKDKEALKGGKVPGVSGAVKKPNNKGKSYKHPDAIGSRG